MNKYLWVSDVCMIIVKDDYVYPSNCPSFHRLTELILVQHAPLLKQPANLVMSIPICAITSTTSAINHYEQVQTTNNILDSPQSLA